MQIAYKDTFIDVKSGTRVSELVNIKTKDIVIRIFEMYHNGLSYKKRYVQFILTQVEAI